MVKRFNENSQLSKEDYEAADSQKVNVTSGSFEHAADTELKKRRIIRVRRSENVPASTNAFSAVNLTAGTSGSGFSFSSTPAPATSAFSFGGDKAATPKTGGFSFGAPSTGGFSFGNNQSTATSAPAPAATAVSAASIPSKSAEIERLVKEREEDITCNFKSFQSCGDIYQKERILHKMFGKLRKWKKVILEAEPAPAAASATGSTLAPSATLTTPVAPAPSVNTNSTTPASATTLPSNTAGNSSSSAPPPPPNDGGPSDEVPTVQGAAFLEVADPDWNDVASFENVTVYRSVDGGWKPVLAKTRLRLQTSKTDASKHRMTGRDVMGKPLVNMAISTGMPFNLSIKDTKRGQVANIVFMGINEAGKGPEKFFFRTQVEEGQRLHQKLEELAQK